MKTTKEEREIAKEFIKHLEKMNNEGRLKLLETDTKVDIREGIMDGGNKVTQDTVKGSFIDVAYRAYLVDNAIRICKNIGVSFEVKEDDTFVCDGKQVIGLKQALSYIYNKEAKKDMKRINNGMAININYISK